MRHLFLQIICRLSNFVSCLQEIFTFSVYVHKKISFCHHDQTSLNQLPPLPKNDVALKPLPLLSERNNTALVTAVISVTANDSVTISF